MFSFPPVELPPDVRAVQQTVRAFLREAREAGRFTPHCSGWIVFDRDFSRLCAEQGLIGMTWPTEVGGRALSSLARYVALEELLAAGAPVGAHWVADRQSGPQILKFGSAELKAAVLPGICRGELSFAIGMSEPDSGSDLASIRSRAKRVSGGWRLNGRKIWTTNGHKANYIIGLFRTEEAKAEARHAGMTQFVVDLTAEGVERRPIDDMPGTADFAELTFDDVFVPDSHVLGAAGDGWQLVTGELANERSGPERFLSVMPLVLEMLSGMDAQDDGQAEQIGRIVAHISVLRAMSMATAGRLGRGESPALEAAVTKDLGNELEREIPEILRRMPGCIPFVGGGNAAALLRDAVLTAPSFTLRGGTPEILRGIIARGLGMR